MLSAITIYTTNGFNIKNINADLEFNCLKPHLPVPMNIIDKDSHVHPAERSIRTVKERARCTVQSLPFSYHPFLLTAAIMYDSISNLNIFPYSNGITNDISPSTFVTGTPKRD